MHNSMVTVVKPIQISLTPHPTCMILRLHTWIIRAVEVSTVTLKDCQRSVWETQYWPGNIGSRKNIEMCITICTFFHLSSPSKIGPSQVLATPQQRRALLEKSSGSKSKMPIENCLTKIDAYRYSTPKVVYSMPLSIQRRDPRLTNNL